MRLPYTLSLFQILVKGFPANTKLTRGLRFAHPGGDPLAKLCGFHLR